LRISATLVALALLAVVALGFIYRPGDAIRVATGYVAHNVCSKTFVSGLDPQAVFTETIERDGIRSLRRLMRLDLDRAAKTVDVTVLGGFRSHAIFRDGFGCVLQHGTTTPYLPKIDLVAAKTPKAPPLLPEIADAAVVEPTDPALKTALDHAFEEPANQPFRRTKAVVVVRDGRVIAERYAAGIGVDTELLGFSMTKSVINALLGIMTQQDLLSPSVPAPVPEWRNASDPRREIEVGHLMKMTTGLDLDETNSGFDPSSRMMYLPDDMAGFAVQASLIAPVGVRW
ncbi:MAG: serine hydrolase, partial [Bradyrhizobium guangdongense]